MNDALNFDVKTAVRSLQGQVIETQNQIAFWVKRTKGIEDTQSQTNARLKAIENRLDGLEKTLQAVLDRLPPAESKA